MAKPSVLVLTSTFPRWANDTVPPFVFELCRRLTPYFDLHVLAPHCPGSPTSETMEGIHVHRFRYGFTRWEGLAYGGGILPNLKRHPLLLAVIPLFLLGQMIAALRLLRRHRIRAIHAHWILPQGLIALLSRKLAVSQADVLCTVHGSDVYGLGGRIFDYFRKRIIGRCDRVTVVSQSLFMDLARLMDGCHKMTVIPMGVDLKRRFIPPPVRDSAMSLLFVGRLEEKKGLRYLLNAMVSVVREFPEAHLTIVGEGSKSDEFKGLASSLGLTEKTTFVGALSNPELPPLFQRSNIFVFPTIVREGFGIVLVEAMGCGCAAVTTGYPALRDIAVAGESALVVPPRSAQALAEAIIRLGRDPALRARLSETARTHVRANFDWGGVTARYQGLIDELVQQSLTCERS